MNRICIGVLALTPEWISMLDSLGVRYEEVRFENKLTTSYSVLIVNKHPTTTQLQQIQQFLKESGSLLFTREVSINIFDKRDPIDDITIHLPTPYQSQVSTFSTGRGIVAQWKASPENDFADTSYHRKRFYFRPLMHPDELVSSVDKNALLVTLDRILSELHFHRSLPYIKKWHSPTEKPVFGFRIDSDFGTKQAIKELYQLSKAYSIPFTWFLHVQAHEEWLEEFKKFEHQEIALHGYEHGTSASYEHIFNNIETGYRKLSDVGIEPKGFCVPYGIWNEALGDVLKKFECEYSSEFTLGYDCVPFFPIHKGTLHPTLQIPIHPICTGSLNRKAADEVEMTEYFEMILAKKLRSREPVFFYHHPMQIGINVWKSVFKKVQNSELNPITFLEYALFWKQRNEALIEAKFDRKNKVLTLDSSDNNIFVKIAFSSKSYRLMPTSKTSKPLDSVKEYEWVDPDFPSPKTQSELQRGKMQLIKTSLLDWRNRKTL